MPHPSTSSAYGIWSLNEVRDANRGGNWPVGVAKDPYFANVSLLINADGLADGSTAIVDASSNSNTVNVNGNAQVDTAIVKYGTGSIKFDGTTATHLQIPWSNSLFDFGTGDSTIEYWAYNLPGSEIALSWGESVDNRLDVGWYVSTDLRYLIEFNNTIDRNESGFVRSSVENQWAHFAFVRDGNTIRIFVDGVQVHTGSWTLAQPTGSSSGVIVGRRSYSGGHAGDPFDGYIDSLRITKGVARYTANFTPPTEAFPTE